MDELRPQGTLVLAALAASPCNASRVVSAVGTVNVAMTSFPLHSSVQVAAVALLARLAQSPALVPKLLRSRSAVEAAARLHASVAAVTTQAQAFLAAVPSTEPPVV